MPVAIESVLETGSTNSDLLARLRAGEMLAEGYWLRTERQISGRGRQGRHWLDAPGNFMGSTVVHLDSGDPPAQTLSFVAALSLYEAILPYLEAKQQLQLKWPNDVLLAGDKLSGILLERFENCAVIGVGVNLAASPLVEGRATRSLSQMGRPPSPQDFALALALRFEGELDRWRHGGTGPLFARWLAAAHPLGTSLSVHDASGERVSGAFAGLAGDGALQLRLADGTMRAIHAGDVTLEGA